MAAIHVALWADIDKTPLQPFVLSNVKVEHSFR
jgi:hypothetical protein